MKKRMENESASLGLLGRIAFATIFSMSLMNPLEATSPMESNIYESKDRIELRTDDDLSLELDRALGDALRLIVGDVEFGFDAPLIRFEEVVVPPEPSVLWSGQKASEWNVPPEATEENVNGHQGKWIRVSGKDPSRPKRNVSVNQAEPQPLVLSGRCQARVKGEAFGWFNRHLALNANVIYTDGTRMPEQSAYFGQYDHGPQFSKRIICPDRAIEEVNLDLSVPGGDCTAWYSDIELSEAQYRHFSPQDSLQRVDHAVLQNFEDKPVSLSGMVRYESRSDHIRIRVLLESNTPQERALSGYVTFPVDAVGGTWRDDVRSSRKIESGQLYRRDAWFGAGRDGFENRYPLACIETKEGHALTLATSVYEPRVFHTEYDAGRKEFRIRFDVGLSPDAGRWANRGDFTVYLFTNSGGFRGATEKYYRLFESAFENRVERQGTWLAFLSPLAVPGGCEDFHFQFLESVGTMGWAHKQNMLSFRYMEPWIHHHEFPPHVPAEEVHGPVVPSRAVECAKRITASNDVSLPLDMRRRYPAYLGSYIEDAWGEPQGYYFRHPSGGRNENMMIVNPNHLLPVPEGAHFCSGGWDREGLEETMQVQRQWHLPGWVPARVSARPFLEVDLEKPGTGQQSVRFDPVESKSYYEQYLRGISQRIDPEEPVRGPFRFSFKARGENVPKQGTSLRWRITFWHPDGTSSAHPYALEGIDEQWQRWEFDVETEKPAWTISLTLDSPPWEPDPTVLWLDDIYFGPPGDETKNNLLHNPGFEDAELLPCQLDGVYLDTIECYECNLNYRREHWLYAEEPLTFDWARRPALHQVFSHACFVRNMERWLRREGMLLFGNCVPRTPFVAPYLDIMGTELNWKHGGGWNPWPDSEFNFARFMAAGKPYCILQYADLTVEEQERYVKRCLFYGAFPSNQAAPSGGWYWCDPVVVRRHREVFAEYVPKIIEVAQAGWQPVTLASCDNPNIWIERFGNGNTFYLTIFNSSGETQTGTICLEGFKGSDDPPSAVSILTDEQLKFEKQEGNVTFRETLGPENVQAYRISVGN